MLTWFINQSSPSATFHKQPEYGGEEQDSELKIISLIYLLVNRSIVIHHRKSKSSAEISVVGLWRFSVGEQRKPRELTFCKRSDIRRFN